MNKCIKGDKENEQVEYTMNKRRELKWEMQTYLPNRHERRKGEGSKGGKGKTKRKNMEVENDVS